MANKSETKPKEISFSKKIYSAAAVEKAVKDFSEAADFKVKETAGAVRVLISNLPKGQEDELMGEFLNYTLCLTKTMQEQTDG